MWWYYCLLWPPPPPPPAAAKRGATHGDRHITGVSIDANNLLNNLRRFFQKSFLRYEEGTAAPNNLSASCSCNVIRNSSQESAWQQLAAGPLPAGLLLLPMFTTQLSFIDPFYKLSILRTTPILLVLLLVAIFRFH